MANLPIEIPPELLATGGTITIQKRKVSVTKTADSNAAHPVSVPTTNNNNTHSTFSTTTNILAPPQQQHQSSTSERRSSKVLERIFYFLFLYIFTLDYFN